METLDIKILYGSETGTAQDTAEGLWKLIKRYKLNCSVMCMDDYNIENLITEKLIIFITSTTGQGECPSNMKKFWRFLLQKKLPKNLLINFKYAVLGLGDSSYEKYNYAAKKLHKRLLQLGGTSIISIGLADDQHDLGIDAAIDPWIQKLFNQIGELYNITLLKSIKSSFKFYNNNNDDDDDDTFNIEERYDVTILSNDDDDDNNKYYLDNIYMKEVGINENLKVCKVIDNIKLTAQDHYQDVRLIKLLFNNDNNIDYEPGDVIYLRPENSLQQIDNFFELLKQHNIPINKNTIIKLNKKEIKIPYILEEPVKLEQLVKYYWDLNYIPRRSTMYILASISDNKLEKDKLIEFTTADGQEELFNYVNRPRRNIIEVLNDFPNTAKKLNEKILFEIMSPIKQRAFSIASSNKYTKNQIDLLVAVVKYKTNLITPRFGLCSNWLASLKINNNNNNKIICWLQKGTFKFDYDKPMILIGPGTGLAPFRSLLLERLALKHDFTDTVLFFGCRYKDKDNHCRNDIEKLIYNNNNNNNLKVFFAFSRDQENKIYVQHIIREQGKLCWELLSKGGKIYLSGSSKNMPKDVRDEFIDLSKKFGNFSDTQAEEFIKQLEKTGRYQTETWA
ncbi:GSCOCT00009352001.2-RA-CDS [Cotesia congregata]|uniref:NADPH-dependent diflavin oxidoreductase 1 n=1 Tax=Cotesia congregata TaxID=51543 RepID=A0A8J2HPH7_COTCN|nr:GSCOCT00009352001.2-RA-CDS [Cotesia congregata]CAG5101382.1 NADPH-dependent diflavin oxidoreductase 1 [Cotesia congregata]